MNPYQPGEDNQDPYEVGYKAGAASLDAEVVSLTNQRSKRKKNQNMEDSPYWNDAVAVPGQVD